MDDQENSRDKKVLVNFLLDADIRDQLAKVCNDMGITVSAALRYYCYRVARTGEIPFKLSGREAKALQA